MYPKHYADLFRHDIDKSLAFVGMSFHPADLSRWRDIVAPAITREALSPTRVDMTVISDSILTDILRLIQMARVLIFDISTTVHGTRNTNVMYELGIAHALRHPEEVLILRSDADPLPFDISTLRVCTYNVDNPESARLQIQGLLRSITSSLDSLKSSVIEKVVQQLDEVCLWLLNTNGNMPYFSLLDEADAFTPKASASRAAVRHMMDLGMIRLVVQAAEKKYAFSWTDLGTEVLRHIGLRH